MTIRAQPVPVTEEMVERLTDWFWDRPANETLWSGDRDDYRAQARAALGVALNGAETPPPSPSPDQSSTAGNSQ